MLRARRPPFGFVDCTLPALFSIIAPASFRRGNVLYHLYPSFRRKESEEGKKQLTMLKLPRRGIMHQSIAIPPAEQEQPSPSPPTNISKFYLIKSWQRNNINRMAQSRPTWLKYHITARPVHRVSNVTPESRDDSVALQIPQTWRATTDPVADRDQATDHPNARPAIYCSLAAASA